MQGRRRADALVTSAPLRDWTVHMNHHSTRDGHQAAPTGDSGAGQPRTVPTDEVAPAEMGAQADALQRGRAAGELGGAERSAAMYATLQRRPEFAQATGVLIAHHGLSVVRAQEVLVGEAVRRGVDVLELARAVALDPASARQIPAGITVGE